jgi:hypothetical protein
MALAAALEWVPAMSQVFISHVEEDAGIALEIAHGLESAGWRTWYYERDSDPGLSYLIQINQAILESQAIVVIISAQSLTSHQVTKEVVLAHECDKPFIPVLSGVSHAEFQDRQPEWRIAMGAAASIPLPLEGASAILPKIQRGLQKLAEVEEPKEAGSLPTESRAPARRQTPAANRLTKGVLLGCAALVLLALGLWLRGVVFQKQLEEQLSQTAEFSDSYVDDLKYWSVPATWKVDKRKILVSGPGIGLIAGKIFGDFRATFNLKFLNEKGAIWVLRAKDRRNYYSFHLAPAQESGPGALVTSVCKDGKLSPISSIPVSQNLRQSGDWFSIFVEAKGKTISHKIEVASQPSREPQNLGFLEDSTFSYGGIGFSTKDGEEFYSGPITVVPIKPPDAEKVAVEHR